MISYGRQWINSEDIKAVTKVMRSDFLTQGEVLPAFEKALADYTGARYAALVSSGTAALHLAYLSVGIGPGDEIIMSPLTFAATANAALYAGAKPVFVDIDPLTGLMDPDKIEGLLTTKTKAIVPVHYAGLCCDMKKIRSIAEKRRLFVIEDACHALGASENGVSAGSCFYSDMTVFSFHPVKHITTGEGGAVVSNNEKFYRMVCSLRSHGIEKTDFKKEPSSPCYQEMAALGFNYRMTEIQAALGLSQLGRVDRFLEKRREIADYYAYRFRNAKEFRIQEIPAGRVHAYHLFPLLFKTRDLRDKVFYRLKNEGVSCQIHYIPVNAHLYYEKLGYDRAATPLAYDFYERELSIPIYPKMGKKDMAATASAVIKSVKSCGNG